MIVTKKYIVMFFNHNAPESIEGIGMVPEIQFLSICSSSKTKHFMVNPTEKGYSEGIKSGYSTLDS